MENTYWFRWFLICSALANKVLGHQPQNFARLIIEEENGRYGNEQMTRYFNAINLQLCEIMANDETSMEDELDFEELAELSVGQIAKYYEEFCNGKLCLKILED